MKVALTADNSCRNPSQPLSICLAMDPVVLTCHSWRLHVLHRAAIPEILWACVATVVLAVNEGLFFKGNELFEVIK